MLTVDYASLRPLVETLDDVVSSAAELEQKHIEHRDAHEVARRELADLELLLQDARKEADLASAEARLTGGAAPDPSPRLAALEQQHREVSAKVADLAAQAEHYRRERVEVPTKIEDARRTLGVELAAQLKARTEACAQALAEAAHEGRRVAALFGLPASETGPAGYGNVFNAQYGRSDGAGWEFSGNPPATVERFEPDWFDRLCQAVRDLRRRGK